MCKGYGYRGRREKEENTDGLRIRTDKAKLYKIVRSILDIRATGLTNMFDIPAVQKLAYEKGFYELVVFLEEHKLEYVNFILSGKLEGLSREEIIAFDLRQGMRVVLDDMPTILI